MDLKFLQCLVSLKAGWEKYVKLGFSSKFDERNQIAVVVTILRKSENRVFQHNLRKAGLNFLPWTSYSI